MCMCVRGYALRYALNMKIKANEMHAYDLLVQILLLALKKTDEKTSEKK